MSRIEDKLCNQLWFGISLTPKEQAQGRHVPTLWEVCHDLDGYIKQGQLEEIPINCSLSEIFEAENFRLNTQKPRPRILALDYFGEEMKIHFKTVPGGALYELVFSKGERTAHSGQFKRIS